MLGLHYHNVLAQFSLGRVWALWCAKDAEVRETLVAPAWDESLATNRTGRRLNSPDRPQSPVNSAIAQKDDQKIHEIHNIAGTRNSD